MKNIFKLHITKGFIMQERHMWNMTTNECTIAKIK